MIARTSREWIVVSPMNKHLSLPGYCRRDDRSLIERHHSSPSLRARPPPPPSLQGWGFAPSAINFHAVYHVGRDCESGPAPSRHASNPLTRMPRKEKAQPGQHMARVGESKRHPCG